MKILIAVDGSAASLDAVALAGRLVNPAADEVALYFSPLELEKKLPGSPKAMVEGAAAAIIDEAKRHLPDGIVAPVQAIHSSKPAAIGILEAAGSWRADAVVVGARGMGTVERLLLGSVSRAVLHGAHLPVLVARQSAPAGRGLHVLACHHEKSAAAIAKTLGMLHWPASTRGHVIGVAESMLAGPLPSWLEKRARDPDTAAIAKAWQQEHAAEVSDLTGRLDAFKRSLPTAFHAAAPIVVEGNPAEKIIATAKADDDDLIVVGRTPTDALSRWLLGSTSEAVIVHAHASVLLVPVEKTA
jgi:nucleotide-binding universal stress UspA family protein